MKDKEWLKEKVRDIARQVGDEYLYINIQTVLELIDQLDQPKVLSQEWIRENAFYGAVLIDDLQNLLVPTLSKKKKVQLSQKTADELNRYKELGYSLKDLLVIASSKQAQEKLARAWLDGYKIEEEPLYYVMKDGVVILSRIDEYYQPDKSHWIGTVTNKEYIKENPDKVRFTEQEIKDYDERFWAFAVPVEEVAGCYKEQTDLK